MSEPSNDESIWGAVQVREPEAGTIVFEAVPSPEHPLQPGEPRTVVEAFTLWQEKELNYVRIRRVDISETAGVVTAITVAYIRTRLHPLSLQAYANVDHNDHWVTFTYDGGTRCTTSGRVTTYVYEVGGRLLEIIRPPEESDDPTAPDAGIADETLAAPVPEADEYVLTVTDRRGRSFQRVFAAQRDASVADTEAAARLERTALANAIDLLPLLSPRWRLVSAGDGRRDATRYTVDASTGAVTVTPREGAAQTFDVPDDQRLIRVTDPETGAVEHVLEPVGHEVVYEFGVAGCLVRANPPGRPRRVL